MEFWLQIIKKTKNNEVKCEVPDFRVWLLFFCFKKVSVQFTTFFVYLHVYFILCSTATILHKNFRFMRSITAPSLGIGCFRGIRSSHCLPP